MMSQLSSLLGRSALSLALLAMAFTTGCSGESDRYEKVDKLRALGVSTSPKVVSLGDLASMPETILTFVAVVPLGQTVTAAPYLDDKASFAVPTSLAIVDESYEEHAALRIYKVRTKLELPKDGSFTIPPGQDYGRLRYGLRLTAGSEEELIVGTLVVYAQNGTPPAYQDLAVSVAKPFKGASVGGKSEDLEASISNPNEETIRIGWFVSSGKVKNRRARVTEWESDDAGHVTLIATVRGMKSGVFHYDVADVVR